MAEKNEPIGVIGVGWVGLVTAACFAELGHPVFARDIVAEKVEALAARRDRRSTSPASTSCVARNAERLTFTTDMQEVLDAARLLFVCVDTPPTASGDADLSRVRAVVDELGDGDHVLVMKSTVPAGTGAAIRREHSGPYVSCPEFLKEGSAVADFMHPDRVVIGADPGHEEAADAVAALYAPLGGETRPHRRDQRRDDQARLERLPRDQDLLHQRDRQRLRGGRRRRRRGRPRDGPRRADRPLLPARRDRLRGQLLPQGRQRAEDARRQHRLPLPAAQRGDRGQRAAEAARGRQAAEAPRLAASAAGSRCSASPSSRTPTTCAKPRAWCSPPACRARGRRWSPTTRWRASAARDLLGSVELADSALAALEGADAAVLVTEWPEFAELDWAAAAEAMARPLIVDGRNFLDPEALRAAGLRLRGDRPRRRAGSLADSRGLSRCRRSSWSAARGRGCGR